MTLMRGATNVRKGVIAFLKEQIPVQREFALVQWGLEEEELPAPSHYVLYEPRGLAHLHGPLIGCEVSRGARFERVDYDPSMGEQYLVNYTTRVVGAVLTPRDDDDQVPEDARYLTTRIRDDLASLVRSALLSKPSMGQPGFYFQERTLVEDYMEVVTTSVAGEFAGTFVFTFTLQVDESQYREALGEVPASGVIVETVLLPTQGE